MIAALPTDGGLAVQSLCLSMSRTHGIVITILPLSTVFVGMGLLRRFLDLEVLSQACAWRLRQQVVMRMRRIPSDL